MSIYKFVELVGTSTKSWEDAAMTVINEAEHSLDQLRIAEVVRQDIVVAKGQVVFRIRLNVSFKYMRDMEEAAVPWGIS